MKMSTLWIVLFSLVMIAHSTNDLVLMSKTRSEYLEKYSGYSNVIILHFNVPQDASFASFRFEADQTSYSIFSCSPDEVTLYMKHGSPPVINPDGSKIPKEFFNASRPNLMLLEFSSDKKYHYINMSSPSPGSYFAAPFHPYVNPHDEAITQQGLTPTCLTYVDAYLYVKTSYVIDIGRGVDMNVELSSLEQQTYKFYVPENVDHILLTINNVTFCNNCSQLLVYIQANNIPTDNSAIAVIKIDKNGYNRGPVYYQIWAREDTWYYILFKFETQANSVDQTGSFVFEIKTFSSVINTYNILKNVEQNLITLPNNNSVDIYKNVVFKKLRNDYLVTYVPYKQYDLVRDGKTGSFLFSFELHPNKDGSLPIAVNLTSTEFTALKFVLNDAIDVGGTLQFILAFKPRIRLNKSKILRESEPENHTVVACIRNNVREIPSWPDKCSYNTNLSAAPIILNKTVTNSTVMVPYPEAGIWFATFKLYCGECEPCNCSDSCRNQHRNCSKFCEQSCNNMEGCDKCMDQCALTVVNTDGCEDCDCDGPCKKTDTVCNSSVLFDINSYPCVSGSCGQNGRCVFMVAEGFVYSTCICRNNYKGWDCQDDSDANSFAMIVLELLLLVLSNLLFLPAVYVAYLRGYYVESIVYFSTFFFSTFYHACDAGENIISFCMAPLSVLQFSDFFSGVLSIWVTLIAMAYLAYPWPSLCHIAGAILLAFGTTYNKTSIWLFVVPAIVGIVIIGINWYLKYRITKQLFPSKRYLTRILPVGVVVVLIALLLFALLQTQSNYKYLHSLWHMLMAAGVLILLPNKDNFLPVSHL